MISTTMKHSSTRLCKISALIKKKLILLIIYFINLLQNNKFLKEKEPSGNAKRVCGLIPGHTFKGVKAPKEKQMSDEELTKLMKLDIELHKAQIKLKDQLTEDPLDIDAKTNLKLVEDKISTTKPIIIYQLRKNKKTPEFIINATK